MPQKTNNNIYGLINDLRLELKGDIGALATKVDKLDETVAKNATKQAVSSTKLGMLITALSIAWSTIVTVIGSLILNRHK